MNWRNLSLRVAVVAALLLATAIGCDTTPPASRPATSAPAVTPLPTVTMTIGGTSFTLEVANDDAERQQGLMHRNSMPADHGMIFVFPDEAPRGFWMQNTRIPLDILYVDAAGRVVSVHTMQPFDERSTRSRGPAKYAIELNAGRANELGVKPGDALSLPEAARDTSE